MFRKFEWITHLVIEKIHNQLQILLKIVANKFTEDKNYSYDFGDIPETVGQCCSGPNSLSNRSNSIQSEIQFKAQKVTESY